MQRVNEGLEYRDFEKPEGIETATVCKKSGKLAVAALVFPAVLLIHIFVKADLTLLYFGVMIVMGFLFISKIQIRKPENRQIALMILLGVVEFAALAIVLACVRR